MKLATYKDGSRDGQLVVVSRDLSTAHYASGIATRLQQLLDDWNFIAPQLSDLYQMLNDGRARHGFAFGFQDEQVPLLAHLACVGSQGHGRLARREPAARPGGIQGRRG